MTKCFVIQPFDNGGKFDKRYEDVFEPAIRHAGLEPYRVDRDPRVQIPIEDIQRGIESCGACLADISADNPNVWFELGYAIAAKRVVVLVCSHERASSFPFDVQHRRITKYRSDSPRDFEALKHEITERLKSAIATADKLDEISSVAKVEGLESYEIATLIAVAEESAIPGVGGLSAYLIQQGLEKAGYTRLAATLGVRLLLDKRMLEIGEEADDFGNEYSVYRATALGMKWLYDNQDKLSLKKTRAQPETEYDDDIPF